MIGSDGISSASEIIQVALNKVRSSNKLCKVDKIHIIDTNYMEMFVIPYKALDYIEFTCEITKK